MLRREDVEEAHGADIEARAAANSISGVNVMPFRPLAIHL